MAIIAVITPRERLLLTTLCRLVGLHGLSDSQLKVWLEAVRRLPEESDVPAKTIIEVMKWATAHPHWTTRAVNMGSFVFNWEEIHDQYRGDLRKKKLEEKKADSPALIALRQRYPHLLKHSIVDTETKRRHKERSAPVWAKCGCNGKYVPSERMPGISIPCQKCKPETDKIFEVAQAEVNTEVYGDPRGEV